MHTQYIYTNTHASSYTHIHIKLFPLTACDPSCNSGLKRCTGPTSSECCVAFNEDGNCISATDGCATPNYDANEHNNFTCGTWSSLPMHNCTN